MFYMLFLGDSFLMIAQEFRDQTVGRRPWRPVTVRMSDGTQVEIRHPELLAIQFESFIVYKPSGEEHIFTGHTFYNLDHVLSVTTASQEQASGKI
jgi:hypothetical protein